MKKSVIALSLAAAPTLLFAQQQAAVSVESRTSASVSAQSKAGASVESETRTSASVESQARAGSSAESRGRSSTTAGFSAESRAELEATFAAARKKNVPERPIENRIAEGRAKGASEAQIVIAARRMGARLEASQEAMVRAGRSNPSPDEVERGAHAMERGATSVHIEALVKRAPPDRSLVVAFDVLAGLEARGVAVEHALAQITAQLDARASDGALAALVVGGSGTGSLGAATHGNAAASAGTSGSAGVTSGASGAAGATGSPGATIGAAVSGVIKR